MELREGVVIAAHGRHYVVQEVVQHPTEDGQQYLQCFTRGKKNDVAVGDRVQFALIGKDQGVIEAIHPRTTFLYRSDTFKSKLLAANVDRILIVVATEPSFSDDFISRAIIAAESAQIQPAILLNKTDLTLHLKKALERLKVYADLEYPIYSVSLRADSPQALAILQPVLRQHATLLIGQSGMGKSSLINALLPHANVATNDISTYLHSGKHTTTFTRSYALDPFSTIIDSPGFQEFGLAHLSEGKLERAFKEFTPYLGRCKFYNCHHLEEPECAVQAGVQEGQIDSDRYLLFKHLASAIKK